MKKNKLGLALVTSLLMVTGGVYGSWTYFEGAITPESSEVTPEMGTVSVVAKGVVKLVNKGLKLTVDQKTVGSSSQNSDFTAVLNGTGQLDVEYTDNKQGSAEKLAWSISVNDVKYNEQSILTVTDAADTELTGNTITAADIISKLTFGSFELKTKADYNKFNEALKTVKITITVKEAASK